MSKAVSSPTGRLLRSSRLFALPPPLPQPAVDSITLSGILRTSDSATRPYPTRQAITTPPSSHHRGDWGLKRPIPGRTTKSSTPHIRINAIDNLEHVTDFESAADHTQSLAKWQELNVPIVPRKFRTTISGGSSQGQFHSVFEDDRDNTAFSVLDNTNGDGAVNINTMKQSAQKAIILADQEATANMKQRWKYGGPWVAGLSEDEFQNFIDSAVKDQGTRKEFLAFVRRQRVEEKKQAAAMRLRNERGVDEENAALVEAESQVSDDEFADYLKTLRDAHDGLSSQLSLHIQHFFDLPPLAPADAPQGVNPVSETYARLMVEVNKMTSDTEFGPTTATHPSAGLSYIKSNAYMENHPIYGPQAQHSPIEARVVRPRLMVTGSNERALVGVGGFVADDPLQASYKGDGREVSENLTGVMMPKIEGGNRIWVRTPRAFVDETGRARLQIEHADRRSIDLKNGILAGEGQL